MHITGSLILLGFIIVSSAVILLVLHLTRLGKLIHQRIADRPHRRLLHFLRCAYWSRRSRTMLGRLDMSKSTADTFTTWCGEFFFC
jgi:hypothetical protein